MAAKKDADESSLELLLDTITNSFGGIVFLAILTILLLQRTSPAPQVKALATETQRSQLIRSQTALQEAEAELASLRQAVNSQADTQSRFASAESAAEYQRLQEEREELARTKEAQRRAVQKRAALQADENKLLEDRENLEQALTAAKKTADTVALKLRELEKTRTKDAPVPRARTSTSIASIPLILKNHKLYFVKDYSRGATFARFNAGEFLLTGEEEGHTVYTPNPLRGFLVQDADALEEYLQQKLALVETSRFHVDLPVWTDSFAEFQVLKTVLIRMKLQYRILIIDGTSTLNFTGSDRTVQ